MKKVQKQGMIQIPAHSVTETNKTLKTDKISLIFLFIALYSLQIMLGFQPHILSVFILSLVSVTE